MSIHTDTLRQDVRSTGRVKIYPDGGREIMACSRPIFVPEGWEERREPPAAVPPMPPREGIRKGDDQRSRRRARAKLLDIVRCNRWDWFVTLTLDASRVPSRTDPESIWRVLRGWLSNRVQRDGLAYVLVPEYHARTEEDGFRAIHFHGFFRGLSGVDSGHTDRHGHPVYNLPDWTYGFSTAIRPYGSASSAAAYCVKYITKTDQRIGGRWYYSGGALRRSPEIVYAPLAVEDLIAEGAYSFTVPECGAVFAILREDGSENE